MKRTIKKILIVMSQERHGTVLWYILVPLKNALDMCHPSWEAKQQQTILTNRQSHDTQGPLMTSLKYICQKEDNHLLSLYIMMQGF